MYWGSRAPWPLQFRDIAYGRDAYLVGRYAQSRRALSGGLSTWRAQYQRPPTSWHVESDRDRESARGKRGACRDSGKRVDRATAPGKSRKYYKPVREANAGEKKRARETNAQRKRTPRETNTKGQRLRKVNARVKGNERDRKANAK